MMQPLKRLIAALMALVLICTAVPFPAYAANDNYTSDSPITFGSKVSKDEEQNSNYATNKGTFEVQVGKDLTLTDVTSSKRCTYSAWRSDDPDKATVDETGTVHGVAVADSVTITHEYCTNKDWHIVSHELKKEIYTGRVTAAVSIPVTGIEITPSSTDVKVGESLTFTAEKVPADATEDITACTWHSSNEDVLTVAENGVATLKSAGTAEVWATSGDFTSEKIMITVRADLSVSPSTATLTDIGDTCVLRATALGFTAEEITWSCSDNGNGLVTVENGVVTLVGEFTGEIPVTVTASAVCNDEILRDSAVVTLSKTLQSLTISSSGTEVEVGDTLNLTVTDKSPANSPDEITWHSSDETVLVVNANGVVTPRSEGEATVWATGGNATSNEITIKVSEPKGAWVYVYTKVDGDTTGLTLNSSGWYTLGRVFVPGLPSASSSGADRVASEWLSTASNLAHSGSFLHEHNTGINIANVTFNALLIAPGANDYVGSGTSAWHLDGSVSVAYLASVVYKYVDSSSGRELKDQTSEVHTVGDTITCSTANAPAINGYMCVSVNPEGELTLSEKGTYYVTYTYDVKTYSVTYTDGVDNEEVFADQKTTRIAHGTATPAFNGTPERQGYTFAGWTPTVKQTVTADAVYTATWTANTNTKYKVEHYQQNVNDNDYTLVDSEDKTGTTGQKTNALKKVYTGFTVVPYEQKTIAADGSTVVKIYYNRNTYTVTYTDGVEGKDVFEDQVNSGVRYGAATPAFRGTPTRTGYTFTGWSDGTTTYTTDKLPATVTKTVTYTAQWAKDENATHSVSAQVEYYYGDTLEAAKAKTEADAVDAVQTETGWIGEETTVTVTPNTTDKFVGYAYNSTEGDLSYSVAAEEATDDTIHIVKVYYVKDENAKHSVSAQVQYFYGDTLAEAQAKTEADAVDAVQTETGWIGEETTVTVTPNTTDKFTGYKYDSTEGTLSYSVAAEAATDETTHIVKVYYVKDAEQKHSVSAQVEYYFGDTLAEAKAKTTADETDKVQTATGWIGEATTVTVRPNTTDKFTGYKYQETVGDLSYTVEAKADTDATTHIVKVYYVKYTFGYTVNYILLDREGNQVGDTVTESDSGLFGATILYDKTTRTHEGEEYVFLNVDREGATITEVVENNVLNVYFGIDTIGTTDPDKPDGVPDKYQATVTYVAVNGNVDLPKAVVTLFDAAGKPSKPGTGYLSTDQIPTATASTGYKASEQLWDTEPTTGLKITEDITLKATFIPQVASLLVNKTTNATGQQDIGSEITYTITVKNTGDVTLTDVFVTDALTGNTGDKKWTIASLERGASQTFTTSYTVTKEDVYRTSGNVDARNMLVNTAVATANNPLAAQQTTVITAQDTAENEIAYRNVTVQKEITNPQNVYDFGDVIFYSITVKNEGNVTEDDLTITDRLLNATGNVTGEGWTNGDYNVPVLAPGQKHTAYCSYTVRAQDEGRVIRNNAAVMRNGDEVASSTTGGAQVINLYNLAIVYVDANTGYALAETYLAKLKAGTPFYVVSPVIEGYTTKVLAVQSDADGMPAHDLSIAVVYTPIAPEEEPEEEPKEPEVNVVTPTDDGGYDLTPISELDTPLANMDLGDHTCCIMHFLLMLASLITLAFYTDSRKKHQARIHQLRESLKAEGKNDPSEKM